MKSVLISIQPKWCKLICSGEKTVEVRKTRPKLETPFKVYIYETQGRTETPWIDEDGHHIFKGRGQVIGEFVCDRITEYECSSEGHGELATTCGTCLTYDEIINYCNGNELYGWHISDLVIYDKPRELREFLCRCNRTYCTGCEDFCDEGETSFRMCGGLIMITRPPQSWCYVEETE